MSSIDFRHVGLGALLSEGRLRVPINQREYSWEDYHARALCSDFSDAIRNGKDSYFLGTVVLTSLENGALEVVDGQQRLATTTMLLAAIRDIFSARSETRLVTSIENDYLFRIDPDTEQETPKLTLNLKDNAFFIEYILRKQSPSVSVETPSIRKIREAAIEIRRFIEDSIKPLSDGSKKETLKSWLGFVRDRARVIVLTVPDDVNAYVMFETLNDRGLKVSQADLVKNYIFGRAGDRVREAQTRWTSMMTSLESIGEDDSAIDYLRFMCSLANGLTRERDVFQTIKERVSSQHAALQFAEQLEIFAADYAAMLSPDHPKWNDYPSTMRSSLATLNLFGVTQIRHLMLAVTHHYAKTEADKAFRLFVNWVVRFFIAGGGRGGRLEDLYAKLANAIHTGNEIKTAKDLSDRMAPNTASDDEFKQAFAICHIGKSKLARYYLDTIERKLIGEQNCELVANSDTSVVNLEHIMPLSSDGRWDGYEPETVSAYCTRLGNMVLMNARKNTSLDKKPFSEKRAIYKSSPFTLTSMVSKYEAWGPDQINERQALLAKHAVSTWPNR